MPFMEASVSLDQAIAEKVMGFEQFRGIWTYWKMERRWEIYNPEEHRRFVNGSDEFMPAVWKAQDGEVSPILPHFSTSAAAAFLLVDFMRRDGFSFKLWQPSTRPYNPGDPPLQHAVVSFICGMGPCQKHGNPRENHHGAYDVEAETLPLAVCRAAVLAKLCKMTEEFIVGPG